MQKNFFRSVLRRLSGKKGFNALNILGLAIGVACASLIFLWVEDEVTFNHNFSKREHLYRIYENQTYEGRISTFHATPGPMAASLATDIPGIKRAARTGGTSGQIFTLGEKSISEQGDYADSAIFAMLDLPFKYGDRQNPFSQLHALVVNESMATKFFGNENPLGRSLRINNEQDYVVTGVFKDLPANSSFQFSWLAPIQNIDHKMPWMQDWNANWARTLVELDPAADPTAVDRTISHYLTTKSPDNKTTCFLFAMNDWNLHDNFTNGVQDGGRIQYVRLFFLIAGIILLIACINFMNLSTARSEQRAKEVGVYKVMGASRRSLVAQFLGESIITAWVAVLLSIVFIFCAMPSFNTLVEKSLSVHLFDPLHLFYLAVIATVTGLVAGSYPALYLSSFNPIAVLKNSRLKSTAGSVFVRQSLVIVQFSVSVVLIICTAIIYQQIQHVSHRKLGYEKNNLVYMEMPGDPAANFNSMRQDLLKSGMADNATLSEYPVLQIWNNTDNFSWEGKNPSSNPLITWENVDPQFVSTMGMKLISGRDFYPSPQPDTNGVVINQALAREMGKQGKVGAVIMDGNKGYQVIGIVEDFLYNTLYQSGAPLLLYNHPQGTHYLTIRLNTASSATETIGRIEKIIKNSNPGYPVAFSFVDEEFNQYFKTEFLTGKLAALFAVLAISISCLGLFGLAAHTAERRVKEIAVRKVLGASTAGVAGLLSAQFLKLVGYACLISFPVAWYITRSWLQGFAYHIHPGGWTFAIAGVLAILIAVATISFQTIMAATANPARSLRAE